MWWASSECRLVGRSSGQCVARILLLLVWCWKIVDNSFTTVLPNIINIIFQRPFQKVLWEWKNAAAFWVKHCVISQESEQLTASKWTQENAVWKECCCGFHSNPLVQFSPWGFIKMSLTEMVVFHRQGTFGKPKWCGNEIPDGSTSLKNYRQH